MTAISLELRPVGLTTTVTLAHATCPWESVTFTVATNVPASDGVPLTIPFGHRTTPAGNDPAATDQSKGPVPPTVASWRPTVVPTVPVTIPPPTAVGALAIARDSTCVAVLCTESVTWRVNVTVPLVVGVPVTAPVEGSRVSPSGSEPPMTDQV